MLTHYLLELPVPATFRGGDPDITHLAGHLHGEKGSEMRVPGEEIVDLQQVEARNPPLAERLCDLGWTA